MAKAATAKKTEDQHGPKAQDLKEQETRLPVGMADMEADAGAGFDQADSDSYAIPFLRVLQDLSPQCKKQRSEYVPGAEPGKIFNTVTEELFDEVTVIPCHYRRAMVEWRPRDEGGGFIAEHPVGAEAGLERDGGAFVTSEGNYLMDTRYHYVLAVKEDGGYEPALIVMSSTQIKASRRWMSAMSGLKVRGKNGVFTPPMFSHKYVLSSKPENNDKGDWYGWTFGKATPLDATEAELYEAAKAFREAVKKGEVKEKPPETDGYAADEPETEEEF